MRFTGFEPNLTNISSFLHSVNKEHFNKIKDSNFEYIAKCFSAKRLAIFISEERNEQMKAVIKTNKNAAEIGLPCSRMQMSGALSCVGLNAPSTYEIRAKGISQFGCEIELYDKSLTLIDSIEQK